MKFRALFVLTVAALLGGCDAAPGESSTDTQDPTAVPEGATRILDQSGVYAFYAWREANGVVEGLDPTTMTVVVEGLGSLPEDVEAEEPQSASVAAPEEADDVEWVYRFVYGGPAEAGATPPPPPASGYFHFYHAGARSIKVKTTSTVTSTFYRQATSGAAWTTLYGPTTYSSCTYGYDCTSPLYALKVNTFWSAGTPNVTYFSSTSCLTYRSCP